MTTDFSPKVSGKYWGDPNPLRKKKFFAPIQYRNHEIDCPSCGIFLRTVPLSIVKAEFGVKQECASCGHKWVYAYQEPA